MTVWPFQKSFKAKDLRLKGSRFHKKTPFQVDLTNNKAIQRSHIRVVIRKPCHECVFVRENFNKNTDFSCPFTDTLSRQCRFYQMIKELTIISIIF